MNSKHLIGSKVALVVSDPWEFGTECGTGPFWGDIKDKESGKVLIVLTKTISYGGNKYSICICTKRHQGKDINDILKGEKIAANMMLISAKVASFSEVNRKRQYKTQAIIGTIEQA
jgi:hypothetical protein